MLELTLLSFMAVFTIVVLLAYKNKYREDIARLDKKDFPLKDLYTLGYFILDLVNYRTFSFLDDELKEKYGQLYILKDAKFYIKTHWAYMITLAFIINKFILFYLLAGEMQQPPFVIIGVLAAVPVLVTLLLKSEVDKKIARRHLLLRLDFVELLNKLVLLVNSGMILSQAMNKIVEDNSCERPLYKELKLTLMEINSGRSEMESYEAFANRCRVPEIYRFTMLIVQNMKKGSLEFVSALRILANESWQLRKSIAKELSEQASTKLLFPMMFMLVAIIIIVLTPAILSLMGFDPNE